MASNNTGSRKKQWWRYKWMYLMMLPGILYLIINNYIPMAGLVIAFKKIDFRKGILNSPWNGLNNFKYLFATKDAFIITRNTILYNLVFIALITVTSVAVAIMLTGILFNVLNGILQGGGLYWFPSAAYGEGATYLLRWNAVLGILLFVVGMAINLHSDHVIRHLRQPGDTRHYLPSRGLYRYVTSANYFGELVEWTGFALAAGTLVAWVFPIWTAANLVPRAHAIHKRYRAEFGSAVGARKRVIPFIY